MLRRHKPVEVGSRRKVSLPAALFNKSPLKNSENNSLLANNNQMGMELTCLNHPSKKGKYIAVSEDEDEQDCYYCEKCAILLASNGFEVKKMEVSLNSDRSMDSKRNMSREEQLRNFMKNIDSKIGVLRQNEEEISVVMDNFDCYFEEKTVEAEEYFECVYELVSKQKAKYLEHLEKKKRYSQSELNIQANYIKQKLQVLESMKDDIVVSHQSIVKETPEEDYQLVMTHYRENVTAIRETTPTIGASDCQLPDMDAVTSTLNELMGVGEAAMFSFDSQQ